MILDGYVEDIHSFVKEVERVNIFLIMNKFYPFLSLNIFNPLYFEIGLPMNSLKCCVDKCEKKRSNDRKI